MENNNILELKQKVLQILSEDFFDIDLREERENINIYTEKTGISNYVYQLGIPKKQIDNDILKKIVNIKLISKDNSNNNKSLFLNLLKLMFIDK